jgi:hypothetical protein
MLIAFRSTCSFVAQLADAARIPKGFNHSAQDHGGRGARRSAAQATLGQFVLRMFPTLKGLNPGIGFNPFRVTVFCRSVVPGYVAKATNPGLTDSIPLGLYPRNRSLVH